MIVATAHRQPLPPPPPHRICRLGQEDQSNRNTKVSDTQLVSVDHVETKYDWIIQTKTKKERKKKPKIESKKNTENKSLKG